ncbi:MAG: phytanoyl-CoA dioxygenase family protein [Gammaproteobacteria bacterium]|nr:phytanoyl-CoA dioxygenase family protein [Gammaproteobacteria bacterium]
MLSTEQIAFFKDNGYLIVPRVLDPDLCAGALDRMWAALPPGVAIERDDPSTHVGPFPESDRSTDSLHIRDGYRWQVRDLGTEPLMIDLVYCQTLVEIAEQLLGAGSLRPPTVGGSPMGSQGPAWPGGPVDPALDVDGVRGLYGTLPYGDVPREPDRCHTDGHPFNLGIVGLIDDVPPDGGAFKIWPRSHRRLYPTFQMQYDQPRIPYYAHLPSYKGILHTAEYLAEIEAINRDTQPVDCWSSAGDVVLWHHRTAHMAGHNYSPVIRQAVLYDFSTTDLDRNRMDPPQDDMWRDWSQDVQRTDGGYSAELARDQRLTAPA